MSKKTLYLRSKELSALIRSFHWLRALLILALLVTGAYIYWPFLVAPESTNVLQQGWIRLIHVVCGFILVSVLIFRFYLFFFSSNNAERRSFKDMASLNAWRQDIGAFFWQGHSKRNGSYSALQNCYYLIIYLIMVFMSVTGLALFSVDYHLGIMSGLQEPSQWVIYLMGGLAEVRLWHHYAAWCFVLSVVLHVYMVVWTGIRFKENATDLMITGYQFHPIHFKAHDKSQGDPK